MRTASTSVRTPTGTLTLTKSSTGTTTVARGRGFPRSAVINMTQQMHSSNKSGKVVQTTTVNVLGGSDGSDVLVAFMSAL